MSHKPVAATGAPLVPGNRPRALRSFVLSAASGGLALVLLYPDGPLSPLLSSAITRMGVFFLGFLLLNACAVFVARGVSFLGAGKPVWLERIGLPRLTGRPDLMVFASEEDARTHGLVFADPIGRVSNQVIFDRVEKNGVVYHFDGLRKSPKEVPEEAVAEKKVIVDPRLYVGELAYRTKD